MKDNFDIPGRLADDVQIADVASNYVNLPTEGREIFFFAGDEIVQHADGVTVSYQTLRNVTTDESGPAGYKIILFRHSLFY